MVLIDMEKPQSCDECRFCEYEQGYCTALPVGEWRRITDMSECPLIEQKTGKWEFDELGFLRCSNCRTHYPTMKTLRSYCQHCGAKMEAEE